MELRDLMTLFFFIDGICGQLSIMVFMKGLDVIHYDNVLTLRASAVGTHFLDSNLSPN